MTIQHRTIPTDHAAREAFRASVQRRVVVAVVTTQVLGGAGLAAGVTVGALLARQMFGGDALAGLPAAVLTLGSAATAYVVGRVSQRWGRRPGLGGGFIAGGLGAVGVVVAATTGWIPLLFVSLLVYGAGTATNLQARYAATDLAPSHRRGSAASIAMVSTTLGAVVGPNLVTPMGGVAAAWGIPPLAGPFLLGAAAYLAAGVALLVLLHPDPLLLAERLRADPCADAPVTSSTPVAAKPGGRLRRGIVLGALVMVVAQIVMTGIMTMTPVHMQMHHHGLGAVGAVIGAHVAAMYLPSLVTGMLVDRVGRVPMAVASGVVLVAAGTAAALLGDSLTASLVALVLLGFGWNLGLISGTAMIVDATDPDERARVQGSVDVLIALAGASGGALSGMVMAASGYQALAWTGAVVAVALVPVVALTSRSVRSVRPV
ncbi:MFS transporter [Curtobacterium pusillum]|uniref:MFS transporter n=1 Tax=Curtobacterium pusillum TaxID=69373 RepID=A0ABX2MAK5_9MICO|nr:MFS transporter [Curtobacterium pusillum]NUU14694.1 MFS transporter [Curtobacterium pusillum]GLK31761.1 putative MFS-type transporter YdeG [Curtobacterium pusillum]